MQPALCVASAGSAAAQRFGRGPTPGAGPCFYDHLEFQGNYFCVPAGEVIEALPREMNDRISSIRVDSGRFGRYDARDRYNDRGRYNDRDRGRYDERGVSRERASDVVRRAYLSMLNREPDAGAEGFVRHVMREGWTQQDVERELRRSPEYRQARRR